MADPTQAPDLLAQLLTGGGSTAQIVMAVVLWRMRDDLKNVSDGFRRHGRVLRKMIAGKAATFDDLDGEP